jgi:hypothetical protein
MVQVMKRMLDVVACPSLVGRALSPLDPIRKSEIRAIFDAVRFLKGRADQQTAAAGDRRCAAELGVLLQQDGARAGIGGLQRGRYSGAAAAYDRDIEFF